MPLGTRVLMLDYANLLAVDRGTSGAGALTAAEKNAVLNEVYEWLFLAGVPRVSYFTQSGFTHADGTTVAADTGLTLNAVGGYLMTTSTTNIAEIFSVHFEGVGAADPDTIESAAQLEYLEHGEFMAKKNTLVSYTAPRYVHWRRLAAASAAAPTAVGKWEIMVAPTKAHAATGTTDWWFSLTARKALSLPDADLSSASPLSADASVPELLPHETYLCARLAAYEFSLRSGAAPRYAKHIVRNVPAYLLKSFLAARGLGEISVPAGVLG